MYYDDYEESYYDYGEANEEALDMAIDMADRYGFAIEDAYMFALEKVDPDKVYLNYGVRHRYTDPYTPKINSIDRTAAIYKRDLRDFRKKHPLDSYDDPDVKKSDIRKSKRMSADLALNERRGAQMRKERAEMIKRLASYKNRK